MSRLNLEFLRKEAKSFLKLCRAGDAAALARLRLQLPAQTEIQLADVQHAMARESGYANWAELKRQAGTSASPVDFTRPGSEGTLPDGFIEWQRGVTCTVRPEMLKSLRPDEEYYLLSAVSRRIEKGQSFTDYEPLYRKAIANARSRIREFRCEEPGRRLHTWIAAHAWMARDVPKFTIVGAFVTLGVSYLAEGSVTPRCMTRESPELKPLKPNAEGFVDFDLQDRSASNEHLAMFSYGEYVPTTVGLDYEQFVRRAEHRTRCYHRMLSEKDRSTRKPEIVRRQWFCATSPDIAVVHIYFRV